MGDIKIRQMLESGKQQYFESGAMGYKLPPGLAVEVAEEWKKEYDLCNCTTCYDRQCTCRNMTIRFPVDAGGRNQCLRYMESKSRFVWRNGNGEIIEIPLAIIKAIRDK